MAYEFCSCFSSYFFADFLSLAHLMNFTCNSYAISLCMLNTYEFHPSHVWWLILHVNLTGLKDALIAGKTLYLDVSARLFLENISTGIRRLSKNDPPSPMRWHGQNRNRLAQKRERKSESTLLICLAGISILSSDINICASGCQAFRLRLGLTLSSLSSGWILSVAFPVPWMTDGGL